MNKQIKRLSFLSQYLCYNFKILIKIERNIDCLKISKYETFNVH